MRDRKNYGVIDNCPDVFIKTIIPEIRSLLKSGFSYSQRTVFLCGKDKSDKKSLRYKFSKFLANEKNITLTYPEDLFEDLLEGQKNSLLDLENQLANAVDLIIMIPESPGSFAELGAFSMDENLTKKMLIIRIGKFKSDKSFINHGPIRYAKSHGSKVYDIPTNFDESNPEHVRDIIGKIKRNFPNKRSERDYDNFLLYSKHILLLAYLFDYLNQASIYKIMALIMNRNFDAKDNRACEAATHSLIRAGHINLQEGLFSITNAGCDFIISNIHTKPPLAELRTKIMNKQYARH